MHDSAIIRGDVLVLDGLRGAEAEQVADWETGTICGIPTCKRSIPPGTDGYWIPAPWFPSARTLVCAGCAGWQADLTHRGRIEVRQLTMFGAGT